MRSDREVHNRDSLLSREQIIRARAREPGPVRARIVDVTVEATRDFGRAPDAIARGLRNIRDLSSAERRFVAESVHALLRWRRRLAFLVGREDPDELRDAAGAATLLDAWLEQEDDPAAAEAKLSRLAESLDPIRRLAVSQSYPDWLVERLVAAFGLDEAEAIARAMNRRAPLTVRANTIKCTREELAARLAELGVSSSETRLARYGLVLDTRRNVYEMAPFREGWMELQDEGSQLLAELCAPPPRGSVVDACAGAGGKTLALAAALENRGRLLALDVSEKKLDELRRRARRAGLTNVRALAVADSMELPPLPQASRVLVDAPCSGTGVIRRNPETRWRLGPGDLDELPRKQRSLLDRYATLVEPGGRLVYATCSLLADENERVVEAFLDAHAGFERVPAKEILGKERALQMGDGEVLRVSPARHDSDGFFGAVLRRKR